VGSGCVATITGPGVETTGSLVEVGGEGASGNSGIFFFDLVARPSGCAQMVGKQT
jgi:hypothetical protein